MSIFFYFFIPLFFYCSNGRSWIVNHITIYGTLSTHDNIDVSICQFGFRDRIFYGDSCSVFQLVEIVSTDFRPVECQPLLHVCRLAQVFHPCGELNTSRSDNGPYRWFLVRFFIWRFGNIFGYSHDTCLMWLKFTFWSFSICILVNVKFLCESRIEFVSPSLPSLSHSLSLFLFFFCFVPPNWNWNLGLFSGHILQSRICEMECGTLSRTVSELSPYLHLS